MKYEDYKPMSDRQCGMWARKFTKVINAHFTPAEVYQAIRANEIEHGFVDDDRYFNSIIKILINGGNSYNDLLDLYIFSCAVYKDCDCVFRLLYEFESNPCCYMTLGYFKNEEEREILEKYNDKK